MTILPPVQGHTKAYSSHDELLSKGIDLTQLIKGGADQFAVEGASEEEDEEEEDGAMTEWERHCELAESSGVVPLSGL